MRGSVTELSVMQISFFFTSKECKKYTKSANLKSSPGPDGIPYEILFKFNCLHHILATLYNKVNVLGSPFSTPYLPTAWSNYYTRKSRLMSQETLA